MSEFLIYLGERTISPGTAGENAVPYYAREFPFKIIDYSSSFNKTLRNSKAGKGHQYHLMDFLHNASN